MVAANQSVATFIDGVDESLLSPVTNALRLSLHPLGLAPRIVNLTQWRAHIFARLQQQINLTGDPVLIDLLHELRALPDREGGMSPARYDTELHSPVVPLLLRSGDQILSFLSTTMVFGTPIDVTLSELAIETFFPADPETSQFLRALGADQPRGIKTTII
jgi:hypothetical protein